MTARTVVIMAFEGAGLLDVSGPAEVFAVADAILGGGAYEVVIASPDGRDVTSSAGFRIGVGASLGDGGGRIDTLLVPGTWTWPDAIEQDGLAAAVAAVAGRAGRVAGVCAGAFLLGAVGLLDGRRSTTHWMFLDELAQRFPATSVQRDAIFVEDGGVFTSAGVSAGIDLALALVEADHGAALARGVARHLVVFMQRPGGQAQFSVRLEARLPTRSPLRPLLDTIAADPAGDHRLAALSARAGFSERHLARVFARELGMTPARYVESVRVEAARMMLETSDTPLPAVARVTGLGSAETLRRSFIRLLGVTPAAYRRRFLTTGTSGAPPQQVSPPVRRVPMAARIAATTPAGSSASTR